MPRLYVCIARHIFLGSNFSPTIITGQTRDRLSIKVCTYVLYIIMYSSVSIYVYISLSIYLSIYLSNLSLARPPARPLLAVGCWLLDLVVEQPAQPSPAQPSPAQHVMRGGGGKSFLLCFDDRQVPGQVG